MAQYGHNSADALQVMIEAKKLAYADMYHYVGDPRFTPVPVKEMISKDLAIAARETDPDGQGCVPGRSFRHREDARRARQRDHLYFDDRQRRQYRLADPEQLSRAMARAWWRPAWASPFTTAARVSS